ncbi:aminotransferase class V-fold PLP-dependent enzyme [Clostridium grantii]|uniref:cysteine desulfurase n=1 Tax=Clostridium grantii DSM 8605 TaxID=1121316 RepID=A0A1M5S368_9CLOT|nr:aminotransferase class V-fold PLP-dependent enzyme [Clostridium grantii]SHH32738.1 cysteine desulfurase family protein [Clostridium grantii DSM 8605]
MLYLDNAATSFPKPEQVYQAVDKCMRNYCGNPGRAGHKMALQSAREIYQTRELISKLFNIKDPMRIIFTSNATEALNLAFKGLLKPQDHVITSSMEHNSVIRPLNHLKEIGVDTTIIKCDNEGRLNLRALEETICPNTKLICITHASNVTGTLLPIDEVGKICKKHNIMFMVDASQTAGSYEIDVVKLGIDLLATAGHKGLMGPQGTGVLYIKEGIDLKPLKEGGTGSKSELLTQPFIMPDYYESGTLNTPGIVGLGAGIKFILDTSIDKIKKHEQKLTKLMLEELKKIENVIIYGVVDSNQQAAVISFNIKGLDSSETNYILDNEYDIYTRSGLHCAVLAHETIGTVEIGVVRVSFGYFNDENDVITIIEAIKEIDRAQL